MRRIFRILLRLAGALALVVALLLSPLLYIEAMCRPQGAVQAASPILPPNWQRPEARTLMTYPEWHIVHAYDDYAEVIRSGDPADFGFLSSITGFWSSLCALSQASGPYGGVDWETKQMVYTIGVSFTAELALKAAYEETLGRIATWIRGPEHAPLDDLSASQADAYATFLQQVPWYKWDFAADAAALTKAATPAFRDWERKTALGVEYGVKAAYAKVIAAAVANIGADELRLRAIVTGLSPEALAALPDVQVIATRPEGTEIEAPRYRAFTHLAVSIAKAGGDFVEIAGNDEIMFTVITEDEDLDGALHSFARQGNPGYRHLVLLRVDALADRLRSLDRAGIAPEHIHDY